MSYDHSNNPEGATHRSGANFYRKTGPTWMLFGSGGKWIATATDWSWLELNAVSLEAAWTGEGVPPVGTVCEFGSDKHGWNEVRVLAHTEIGANGVRQAVSQMGEFGGICIGLPEYFRPIRTLEQIAWDDMKKVTAEMLSVFKSNYEGSLMDGIQSLYFDGYRKRVTD